MKLKIIGIVVLSLIMTSSLALADTLIYDTLTNSFQSFTGSDVNHNGTPFWDNTSNDTGNKNVGYILTGTNAAIIDYHPNGPLSTQFDWLGAASGYAQFLGSIASQGVVNNVSVQTNSSGGTGIQIVEVAGNWASNVFGIYSLAGATNLNFSATGNAYWKPILSGQSNSNDGNSFTIPTGFGAYGFFFYDGASDVKKLFVSDPIIGQLTSADNNSNFAFFQNTSLTTANSRTYFIGMEDLVDPISGECLGDYNDLIVEITIPSNVPVPPSALLLGTGLLGLVGFGWRRRQKA